MALELKSVLKDFLAGLGLRPDEAVLCAVSGGADSLCLLLLLHEALGPRVRAMHCNHGLRGKDSQADEALVHKLCLERGIGLYRFKKKISKGAGLEERARAWRRSCYADAAAESKARFVFLAHHAADQAETLLLNLIRGAGAQGSLGMLPLSGLEGTEAKLARPWLEVEPALLRAELKRRKIKWREDASNADIKHKRNAIRHQVLPLLEAIWPGATRHLAAFTRRSQSLGLPGLDDKALARVRALLKQGQGSADLKGGLTLRASMGRIQLSSAPSLHFVVSRPPAEFKAGANGFWFADVDLGKQLKVKGAAAGDRFRPFGMRGHRLVFDVLAEAGVPAWKRSGWPLLWHPKTGAIYGLLGVRQAELSRLKNLKNPALHVTWGGFDKA